MTDEQEVPKPTTIPPMAGPPVVVSVVATEYVFTELPPPEGVEPPPEGGDGEQVEPSGYWVIASGGDPNQYWQDGSQEWVPEVDQASLYNATAKAVETLPSDPPTAYWLDRAQVV